jgi:hypothetical protein
LQTGAFFGKKQKGAIIFAVSYKIAKFTKNSYLFENISCKRELNVV